MAIWRPGRPSSMNRAATSLIRVAPRVITTNWITTRIENRIAPTATWSPATNSPNDRTTPPAAFRLSWPWSRTSRVVATLSTSRVSVVVRRIVGKAPKSVGERIARGGQEHEHGQRDVGRLEEVEHRRGHRHDEDEDSPNDRHRQDHARQASPGRWGGRAVERGRHPFLSSTQGTTRDGPHLDHGAGRPCPSKPRRRAADRSASQPIIREPGRGWEQDMGFRRRIDVRRVAGRYRRSPGMSSPNGPGRR